METIYIKVVPIENESINTGGGLVGRGQMNYTYLYTLLWSNQKREF